MLSIWDFCKILSFAKVLTKIQRNKQLLIIQGQPRTPIFSTYLFAPIFFPSFFRKLASCPKNGKAHLNLKDTYEEIYLLYRKHSHVALIFYNTCHDIYAITILSYEIVLFCYKWISWQQLSIDDVTLARNLPFTKHSLVLPLANFFKLKHL